MILLDTHVLIWWLSKIEPLPKSVLQKIETHQKKNQILLSAMSFWEISMLVKKERLALNDDLHLWINKVASLPFLTVIPADHTILVQSVFLPGNFHADPADRMIVATAQIQSSLLITKDKKIRNYSYVKTFWEE